VQNIDSKLCNCQNTLKLTQVPRGHARGHVSTTRTATTVNNCCGTSNSSSSSSDDGSAVRQPNGSAAASESYAVDTDAALDSLALLQHISEQSAEVSALLVQSILLQILLLMVLLCSQRSAATRVHTVCTTVSTRMLPFVSAHSDRQCLCVCT
jgi:hypothetical protein